MVTEDLKKEIIAKMSQGEGLEELSNMYDIPLALLNEWYNTNSNIKNSIDFSYSLKDKMDEIPDENTFELLREKTNKTALAILSMMSEIELNDPITARILQIHADSVAKLRNAFFKAPTIAIAPSSGEKGDDLSMFKKTLKD